MRRRFALAAVTTVVLAGLLTTATWALTRHSLNGPGPRYGAGMMGGQPMMGGAGVAPGRGMMGGQGMMGGLGLPGDGRSVTSIADARQRAQLFADRLGLKVGEVMQFSNGFYAEIDRSDATHATEVLIDPAGGGVNLEYGPAMMWNTEYGMHSLAGSTTLSPPDAQATAQRWLDVQRPGLTAGNPEQFPGYVTLHTMRDGNIVGMMSVNLYTGAVWYHTWHGTFVAMDEG
jgi:hypothetical protein